MKFYLLLSIIIRTLTTITDGLHCFNCADILDGVDCNAVAECKLDESCYIERSGTSNNTQFSLGCLASQNCPVEHPFAIVGRSVANNQCNKCCRTNGCNNQYCETEIPTVLRTTVWSCIDDPGQNCSKMASLFNICGDPHKAKDICRKYCGLCDMVDGGWSLWNKWSLCSTSCGVGVRTRNRQCTNPAPANGGYPCAGNSTQARSCFDRECPVHGDWSDWAPWEACSVSCGFGLRKRHRTCTNPPPSLYGHYCIGDSVEYDLCQQNHCGNDSTPAVSTPTASHCDDIISDCDTVNKTLGVCYNFEAARKTCVKFCGLCGIVDGVWSDWSNWGICSVTCGHGTHTRARTCSNPPPQNGGKACHGQKTESKSCVLRACPVHGGWSVWSGWETCSSTCGQGITKRTRVCDNPPPDLLGNLCFGDSIDFVMCLIKPCPIDGGWTDWLQWSSCSATCGQSQKTKQRMCLNPAPSNGGRYCVGPNTEQTPCNVTRCEVDGGWTDWLQWSSCSVTNEQTRQRLCLNPAPEAGGRFCVGPKNEQKHCDVLTSLAFDCLEILQKRVGYTDGVYPVKLKQTGEIIDVFCDMTTDGGGWTVFQKRFNGSVNFYRNWQDYENGFGEVKGEFWLGLKHIYQMTKSLTNELKIDLEKSTGEKASEVYQSFSISSSPGYTLTIGSSTGTAGDGGYGLSYNNGEHFSAYDMDQDSYPDNCATLDHGGWWYNGCTFVNLNGEYVTPGKVSSYDAGEGGMIFYPWDKYFSLKATEIKFRRK